MSDQLVHYTKKPLGKLLSRKQLSEPFMKPLGLWLSVDNCEPNWLSWCEAEDFAPGNFAHAYDVALHADARILRLTGARDIDDFTREFQNITVCLGSSIFIDWASVAERHDGIIIAPYVWSRRMSRGCSWYYGWDCASGCVWNASAIASVMLRAPAEKRSA